MVSGFYVVMWVAMMILFGLVSSPLIKDTMMDPERVFTQVRYFIWVTAVMSLLTTPLLVYARVAFMAAHSDVLDSGPQAGWAPSRFPPAQTRFRQGPSR